MSLDVKLYFDKYVRYERGKPYTKEKEEVYWANITHNLWEMAREAGIYEALWRPYMLHPAFMPVNEAEWEYQFEESYPVYADALIEPLERGLKDMKERPDHYKQFNSPNGWGLYEHFVPWIEEYIDACREFSDAWVQALR